MQLHRLSGKHKKRRRVGRGGKRGITAGRGQKGQKSRAGRRIRPALRDLLLRLPKHRGFKNKPFSPSTVVVNLQDLSKARPKFAALNYQVNPDTLLKVGLLKKESGRGVKILGKGVLNFPAVVSGFQLSRGAAEKIKKAGGTVQDQNQN